MHAILFSDETKVYIFGGRDTAYVWRKKEVYKPKNTVPTVKHGIGRIMPWGCFTASRILKNFDHSSRCAFVMSDADVGPEGLVCSLCYKSSQR